MDPACHGGNVYCLIMRGRFSLPNGRIYSHWLSYPVRSPTDNPGFPLRHEMLFVEREVRRDCPLRLGGVVSPLVWICQQRLLYLLLRYFNSCDPALVGAELASRAISSTVAMDRWLHNSLHNARWPSNRGQVLVAGLCMQLRFDTRSAIILRNCTTSLDLRFYRLVSNDLVTCLTTCWSFLTELKLNGHHHGQLSVQTVAGLHYLENLRSLFLDGLQAVCDENICDILGESRLEPNTLTLNICQV
ncbi:unnamed protein product [Dicrocoelium dendriticum]|nr:unnamed protein product [Dicrocoelium dendriticum]